MKSLLFVLLLIGQTAFSGQTTPLVSLKLNYGFYGNFKEDVTVIDSDGMVVTTTTKPGLNGKPKVIKREVALLSESALTSLKAKITGLDSELELKAEPGEGPAIDQGYKSVTINQNGAEKVIYRKSQGKTYFLQYHSGSSIINLIEALSELN